MRREPRSHRRLRRNFLPAGLGAVGGLMVIAGAEGPKWGRSPVLDIRCEFITLLGGAAIFVYLLSRTFFPMTVRTYSSCRLLSVCRSTNPLLTSRSIGRRSLSPLN